MIFTSFEFFIFFMLVLLGRCVTTGRAADNWFLLVASYVFYMSWSVPCGLLIFATSLVDFYLVRRLAATENPTTRKCWVALSVTINLSLIGFFKYTNFIVANAGWGLHLLGIDTSGWRFDIILPVGISFFTFQSMSYTLDVYRRDISLCDNLRDYLLFVSFFPQLVAGPIVRAADLLPQIAQRVRASTEDLEAGITQFGLGALKKLVISDQIAGSVDLIFASPGQYDSITLLQGALGYAIQIYCDFSGYSDMAIGTARIMGYHFNENFQMPYSATSITEFWRRWHISLSSWFRDYLYIPLGGNRSGAMRTYVNLLLTMLLCGLWHGASWNFVFWGGLHGVALAVHRVWKAWSPLSRLMRFRGFAFGWLLFSRLVTLAVVLVGWIFFRAQTWSDGCEFLTRLATWNSQGIRLGSAYIIPACVAVAATHFLVNKDTHWARQLPQQPLPIRFLGQAVIVILLVCFGASNATPFIYFQF